MDDTAVTEGVRGNRCPIVDFDVDSPELAREWPATYREMRSSCPRSWTASNGGHWIATRYRDIVGIAQRPEQFTSGKTFDPETGQHRGGIAVPMSPVPALIPDETDRPEWQGYRQFLNRRFAPKAAEERRAFAEGIARTLIDRVIENGRFDIVGDLTNPLPALLTMELFGFDLGDWHIFADPIHKFVYLPRSLPEFQDAVRGVEDIRARIADGAVDRRRNPRDDMLSYLANGEIDGRQLDDEEVIQMSLNIIFGGVDTTTALTSSVLHFLSSHPEQRRRLIDDPSLIPVAREEFVRYFSPVHGLSRNAAEAVEFDGWTFQKGDRVLLAYASGNRDEEIFDNPDELRLDRFPNRHIGFGAGMHRCLGSFFARIMFESMLKEVLLRMPDYAVVEEEAVPYPSISRVNGWITIPATFTPGAKLGGGFPL
jgi:cytochrome P450